MPTIPVQTRLAPPPAPSPTAPASVLTDAPPSPVSSFAASPGPSPSAPSPALDLHIGSLVLHGFSAADGRRAGAAFEQELSRLLDGAESPPSEDTAGSSALAELSASANPAPLSSALAPGSPELTGRRAARALHARLRA